VLVKYIRQQNHFVAFTGQPNAIADSNSVFGLERKW